LDDSITIVLDNRDILSGACGVVNDGNLKVIEGSLGGKNPSPEYILHTVDVVRNPLVKKIIQAYEEQT